LPYQNTREPEAVKLRRSRTTVQCLPVADLPSASEAARGSVMAPSDPDAGLLDFDVGILDHVAS
jgi:hypothetical protein